MGLAFVARSGKLRQLRISGSFLKLFGFFQGVGKHY
jgi:hypothetical protein